MSRKIFLTPKKKNGKDVCGIHQISRLRFEKVKNMS